MKWLHFSKTAQINYSIVQSLQTNN